MRVGFNPAADRFKTGNVPACHTWQITENDIAAQWEHCVAIAPQQRWTIDDIGLLVLDWWQAEFCAVCGRGKILIVDHDHNTNLVRGLLCRSCNRNEWNPIRTIWPNTKTYAAYRKLSPAALLRLDITYRRHTPRDRLVEEYSMHMRHVLSVALQFEGW